MTRNVEASSGFAVSVRSPSPQDAEAIAELRGAVNSAEIGNPYTDAADVLTQLTDPGIDLERDWILVTTPDGELVGSGTVWVESPFLENYLDNYVHPDRNGLGLGTLLLDWAEGRAMEVVRLAPKGAAVVLRHGVWVGAEDGENLLRARGYRVARYFQDLATAMPEPPAAPIWPDGIRVRSMVSGVDEPLAYRASVEGMGEHWGHASRDLEAWHHELTGYEGFDPALVFLATDGSDVVGSAVFIAGTPEFPQSGWMAELSVLPAWRRRGIATALVLHGLGALYARGFRHANTGVDSENPTRAGDLYSRLGFRPTTGHSVFEREIGRGGGAAA